MMAMPEPFTFTPDEVLGPLGEVERKNAPKVLHGEGDLELLKSTCRVSIVGSREASTLGLKRAARLAKELVEAGVVVVSGLARGIDFAAHTSAMHHGGRTIAVLGTPLDETYPREHVALQREIAEKHLVVSQWASGNRAGKGAFPARNRTMALLTHATVVVEAGERSGTIHQGYEALRLGRPLFLMQSVYDNGHAWSAEMVARYGAQVLSETSELLDVLPHDAVDVF